MEIYQSVILPSPISLRVRVGSVSCLLCFVFVIFLKVKEKIFLYFYPSELFCISTGHCIFCIIEYNKVYQSEIISTLSPHQMYNTEEEIALPH